MTDPSGGRPPLGDDAELSADVLVAGAGAAGLAAALAAAQRGLSVLLIDAHEGFREACSTVMSTSMIPAGGSRWQAAAGVADSPEAFLDDVRRKTAGACDDTVAHALTEIAPELVQWLADECAVPLELVTDFLYPGHSRYRCHTVPDRSGRTLHQHLLAAADRLDSLLLVAPRALVGLEQHGGVVDTASLRALDGPEEKVRVNDVVLATAGYAGNAEYVARFIPEMTDATYFGGDGSVGDALRLGESVGADLGFLDAYQGHGSVATPHGVLLTWAVVMHGGVVLNRLGRRFGDETCGYSEYARLVLAQPDATAWVVFDRRIDEACAGFADYQMCRGAGALRWADSVEELAAATEMPVASLRATLSVAGDGGDPFGRADWEARLAPPYAAVQVTGALFHTQGGLHVDATAAVLRDGVAIGGLYAAGGAAVGMSGHGPAGYLAGNGLLGALGLGYIAGRHVGSVGD